MDFIMNGSANGSVAGRLLESGFDVNALKPCQDPATGKCYINVGGKDHEISVNDATLRKEEWLTLDKAVREAARPRMKAINDLRTRGLVYSLNGMATTVLQGQRMSDVSGAQIAMDTEIRTEADRPLFDTYNLPLPIIFRDFYFGARELAVSRNGGQPLDTLMVAQAGRGIAEVAEKLLLGTYGTYTFGGGTIYGYTNHPDRITDTNLHDWAASGITGAEVLEDVKRLKQASLGDYHYGPWTMYVSSNFAPALDDDFKAASNITTRQRLLQVDGIESISTLEYLPDNTVLLVEMQSETVRLINGLDLQTVQWSSNGGSRLDFKAMTILVPQLRSDINGRMGLVHATHA